MLINFWKLFPSKKKKQKKKEKEKEKKLVQLKQILYISQIRLNLLMVSPLIQKHIYKFLGEYVVLIRSNSKKKEEEEENLKKRRKMKENKLK